MEQTPTSSDSPSTTSPLLISLAQGRLEFLRALLVAVTEEIAAAQKGRSMTQTAPLVKQARELAAEIEVVERAQPGVSIVDELAADELANRRLLRDPADSSPAGRDSRSGS